MTLVTTRQRPVGNLTERAQKILLGIIGEHSCRENESGIASNHASEWTIVEVRVGSLRLLEADVCSLSHDIDVKVTDSIIGHVKPFRELVKLQVGVITSQVQVVASI